MASQHGADQLQRFLDEDLDRSVARLYTGPWSTPRRHPLTGLSEHGLHFWEPTDAAVHGPSGYPEYAMSSDADDDSFHKPADFMRTPRQAGLASQADGSSGRFGYTASPAMYHAPSTHASEASSFTPSIFTRASAKTSAGASSRPAPRAHITNFVETLTAAAAADFAPIDDAAPIVPVPASHPLWCELCVTKNCSATFRIDQTREWIDHHCDHLRDRYPGRLVCWFCDHIPFVAAGRTNEERYANFRDRMEHIREHISGEYLTTDHMRPDFAMINYLADNRIIDDAARGKSHIRINHNDGLLGLALPMISPVSEGISGHGEAIDLVMIRSISAK